MKRQRQSGTTDRRSRPKPEALPDRPLDEAEAILRDIEGTAALNEVRAFAAQKRHQATRANRQVRLQGLANFAPIFSAPDFTFGVWQYPPPEPSGIVNLPYCELSDEAHAFVQAAYALGWVQVFDWSAWMETPDGKKLVGNPERGHCHPGAARQAADRLHPRRSFQ